jgi:hypothetical protein
VQIMATSTPLVQELRQFKLQALAELQTMAT